MNINKFKQVLQYTGLFGLALLWITILIWILITFRGLGLTALIAIFLIFTSGIALAILQES